MKQHHHKTISHEPEQKLTTNNITKPIRTTNHKQPTHKQSWQLTTNNSSNKSSNTLPFFQQDLSCWTFVPRIMKQCNDKPFPHKSQQRLITFCRATTSLRGQRQAGNLSSRGKRKQWSTPVSRSGTNCASSQLRRERPSVALLESTWSRYEIPKDHHLRVVAHPYFHPMASLHNPSLRTLTSAH